MKRIRPISQVLVVCALLVGMLPGCRTTRPLPVQEPPEANNVPIDTASAKTLLEKFGSHYLLQATELHRAEYNASDTSFYGGLLAVVGGLTKSPETALIGTAGGGAGAVVSQRYQFKVQAINYEKASDAMFCLRRVLFAVDANQSAANRAYINTYDVLSTTSDVDMAHLNESIAVVRRTLRERQASVELATPDVTKLQAALGDILKAKRDAEEAAKKSTDPNVLRDVDGRTRDQVLAARAAIKAEFDKCVASF